MGANNKGMGVIFDLDGVLVDTSEYHKQSWFDLADKQGYYISDKFFYNTFGMQNYQILPMLSDSDLTAEEIDEMAKWKEKRYRELIDGKVELMDGVAELIRGLKESGFALAIGTSTPRENLNFLLKQLDIRDYFEAYVTGEDVSRGKPAPDTFLMAAEKLSLEFRRCVVVEDAIPGVAAGKNAGMAVVAVTSTRRREELGRADMIVDSLAELNAETFKKLLGQTKNYV